MSIAHEHLLEIRERVKDHLAHKDEHTLPRERQQFLRERIKDNLRREKAARGKS